MSTKVDCAWNPIIPVGHTSYSWNGTLQDFPKQQSKESRQKKVEKNGKKWRQIDEVEIKLMKSQLYEYSHYAKLIDCIIEYVIPFWNLKWRYCQELSGIINKRKITHEIEESVPVLHYVLKMINNIIDNNDKENNKLSIPIIDLCSGKGILSMLIISFIKLVPQYQKLSNYIKNIYLLDRNWDINYMEMEEMKARNQDYTKKPKCAIKSSHLQLLSKEFNVKFTPIRTNIHNEKIIEFLKEEFTENRKVLVMAIHLCRRLSARAIQIYNLSKTIHAFILAPCCLPLRGGYPVRIGPIWNKTYQLWSNKNKHNIDINNEYLMNNKDEIDNDCCYHLALMSKKQICARNKKLIQKFKLNEEDVGKLNKCKNDNYMTINKDDEMFITAELMPEHLHQLNKDIRYNQWINFLFNCIDCNDNDKKYYRVPLTGKDQHRCNAYLTSSRSK